MRLAILGGSLVATTFGACKCDEELVAAPGALSGVVCSADTGAALGGVAVTVTDGNGKEHEALTDATGLFNVPQLSAGSATITIHSADGERIAEIDVASGDEARYQDSTCHPPPPPDFPAGGVQGCICDEAVGQWVSGANVFVIDTIGALYVTGTDDIGCFVLENVPAGPQVVKVERSAFYREIPVEVVTGTIVSVPSPAACEPPPPPEGAGSIEGRVCAPDGETWLAEATVYVIREDGTRAETTTDADGRFTLTEVPPGEQTLYIEKGSFSTTRTVTVPQDGVFTIPEEDCELEAPDLNVAVVSGQWDSVEDVLDDIGIDPSRITMYAGDFSTAWVGDLVENYEVLSQYDIVFFNCGVQDLDFYGGFFTNDVAVDNLRQFVANGGSVYASDQAYDIVERTWPDMVDFVGSDTQGGQAEKGATTEQMFGTITDPGLQVGLGGTTIELHYPLAAWAVMQAASPSVNVYITASGPLLDGTTLQDVPHTVRFSAGQGKVLYTSFHQESNISPQMEQALRLLMFEL